MSTPVKTFHEVATSSGTWNSGVSNSRALRFGGFLSALRGLVKETCVPNQKKN